MMKAYPEYKDSGVEWLGEIPIDWGISKSKYLLNFNMGQSPDSKSVNQDGVGLPFIQGNAEFGTDHPTEKNYCTEPTKICNEGDLLISVRAPVGAMNIANKQFVIGRGLSAITATNKIDRDFLWYSMIAQKEQLTLMETGTTFKAVSGEDLKNIVFSLPSLDEQKAIAKGLKKEVGRVDNLITEKENFIKLLSEKRQALISHVVTKGLNPNVSMKDSGVEWIGEIPESWYSSKLKFIVGKEKNSMVDGPFGSSVDTKTDYVDEGVPVIRTVNITDRGFSSAKLKFMRTEKYMELTRHAVYPNDVLVSKVGTIGNACLLPENINEAILSTTGSCKITVNKEKVIEQFLVYVIRSAKQEMNLIANANVQPFLNMSDIKNISIPLPSVEEQKEILEFLKSKLKVTDLLLQETLVSIELLKEHRTALISAAVTGKIDVREEV